MISAIIAMAHNRVIGKDNDFAWHLRGDMINFSKLTTGNTVVMGRNTYEHLLKRIGKILPNRTNIVITRNKDFKGPGTVVVNSLEEALKKAPSKDVFVIGGAQIFALSLPILDRIYLTEVDAEVEGDAFLPEIDPSRFKEVSREAHKKDERNDYDYSFVVLDRVK
ncbi:dihydrofolate reductase [Candidatus Saccharibacteria bacterium]|nr:dihydrofolate reductase [Candidatus Saccharibacteria bacterium]